ncbi:uroporphyrinogen decarboxylase family protein [Desulfotignum phosphitoxidans]|uniref:Methylcobamide:CoM methyltransferase MtbA n=2 Tax=Desulfotignum phosphitoxidans TaxID=190898 RepID=S0G2K8_9BACT|nr:uroporphyrinogen decarboxylase family protein [Desulfotignum phosphitoxidans]EMS77971.1 methylcobamide:CoM methyltransferase MtbA [Desulfotignum phosphitoxidans DSM 13687]
MTPRQRLLCALRAEAVDRVPVIIPGGMMAGSLYALLQQKSVSYPDLHTRATVMAGYARLLQETCELDNYGVPFCMTIEAEDFGARIDLGDPLKEPRVAHYPAATLDAVLAREPVPCRRHEITLEAIYRLAGSTVPVIGNVIGPISLLTSLADPAIVYRALATDGMKIAATLDHLTRHIAFFAEEQIKAGAEVIVLADPGASGEIIGGEYFKTLAAPAINQIIRAVRGRGIPAVLHICGNIMALAGALAPIPWDALSVDSVVSLKKLKPFFPGRALMGNVSTHLLAVSGHDRITRAAIHAAEVSAILAPACGLSTTTLPENIRSMVRAAQGAARKLTIRPAADG